MTVHIIRLSDAGQWETRLSDADAEIVGTRWCPLPFTQYASLETIRAFYAERGEGVKLAEGR